MIAKLKGFFARRKVTTMSLAVFAMMMLAAVPAFAAPNTGDTDIDGMLGLLEAAFETIKKGFWYLGLAAIPVTLGVVAYFWLRGKFKQSVAGA